jgi:transcriptional regulator with XRE-family HTH domain
MASTSENLAKRDLFYYRRRFLNRVHGRLAAFFAERAEREGITKSKIARRLGCDPAQVTRWLSQPSNLELETISDLLLAMDAEAEPPEIVLFADRKPANYMHPLIARIAGTDRKKPKTPLVQPPSDPTKPIEPWQKPGIHVAPAQAA